MKINRNFVFGLVMTVVVMAVWVLISGRKFHGVTGVVSVLLIFLASYPWTAGKSGNVYSLWGGFSDKDIYSLVGIFQRAEGDAVTIFGLGYQRSLTGLVGSIVGVSYLRSASESSQVLGISYLVSNLFANQFLGICCLWSGDSVDQLFGLVLFSRGKRQPHSGSIVIMDIVAKGAP